MRKVNVNVPIEEQVKKELEGNLLWAYCTAIIEGTQRYYENNIRKYDGQVWVDDKSELQKIHDDSYLEKVKEAYHRIKDILGLDCEEDVLMTETKRIISLPHHSNSYYVKARREAKNDKKKLLEGDTSFIAKELERDDSCKTVEDLIAKCDYEIALYDRLAKETKAIKEQLG